LWYINKTTVGDKSEQFKIKKAVIYKKHIIPEKIVKFLPYDLKTYLIYMNSVLEKDEHKLFQPLRNNIVPKYITIVL